MASSTGSGVIQALGIGSGLDINSLVTQLVQAESSATDSRLTRESTSVATKISAAGQLRGALSSFQSALASLKDTKQFDVLTATSGDEDLFTATASTNAVAGNYDVEVRQLAQGDQLVSDTFAGGATSAVGTGTLTLSLGSTSFAVEIGSDANTLADIRNAINSASNNPGITATLVYGQNGASLVLSSTQTGASNTIRVATSGGDGGLAALTYDGTPNVNYTVKQEAQDAIVVVAGVEKHSSSNSVDSAIDGVTLNLKAAELGTTNTLTVAANTDAVVQNVKKFVAAYNSMRSVFDQLTAYDATTKQAGPLLGDSLMNGIEEQMRRLTTSQVGGLSGNYTSLASLGIVSGADGKLSVDEGKLRTAITQNRDAVANVFASSNGIAVRLNSALETQLGSAGALTARDKSLTAAQESITDQAEAHQRRMAQVEERYLAQFTALDTLMAELNQTSSYLDQALSQLASLNGKD